MPSSLRRAKYSSTAKGPERSALSSGGQDTAQPVRRRRRTRSQRAPAAVAAAFSRREYSSQLQRSGHHPLGQRVEQCGHAASRRNRDGDLAEAARSSTCCSSPAGPRASRSCFKCGSPRSIGERFRKPALILYVHQGFKDSLARIDDSAIRRTPNFEDDGLVFSDFLNLFFLNRK